MTKKVKFKQLQGYVDDILARLDVLEDITDDFNGAIMELERRSGMSKAKRIKTLEGYTQSLEARIEWLEGMMKMPEEMRKLCIDHGLKVKEALKFGSKEPKEGEFYGLGISKFKFTSEKEPEASKKDMELKRLIVHLVTEHVPYDSSCEVCNKAREVAEKCARYGT